jgi:vacuolar-type H+-ATPase subunit I/STV1
MKIKKLIKILKQYNKNRSVKLHTSTCIEDILKVDQSYDADYDEVYLTGNLENGIAHIHRYDDEDKALQHSVSQTNQILKLEQEVSRLREKLTRQERGRIMRIKDLKERNAYLQERIEELIPIKAYPKYDFCEIPNDRYGNAFVTAVKKYLNTNKYKVRVRGQHIKEELKGKGLTSYGQSIDESTHLRVYIEEK